MEWIWGLLFGANLLLLFFGMIFFGLAIIAYIFSSIGLYKIAQKRNLPYPWMAWVPLLRFYLLGLILGNVLIITPQLKLSHLQYILPGAMAVMYFGSSSFLGSLFTLAAYALLVLSYAALFRQYREKNALFYGLLASLPFVEVIGSIFVFRLGDAQLPPENADTTVFPGA